MIGWKHLSGPWPLLDFYRELSSGCITDWKGSDTTWEFRMHILEHLPQRLQKLLYFPEWALWHLLISKSSVPRCTFEPGGHYLRLIVLSAYLENNHFWPGFHLRPGAQIGKYSNLFAFISGLLKSLWMKLSIEHSTTCDSRTHLNHLSTSTLTKFWGLYIVDTIL